MPSLGRRYLKSSPPKFGGTGKRSRTCLDSSESVKNTTVFIGDVYDDYTEITRNLDKFKDKFLQLLNEYKDIDPLLEKTVLNDYKDIDALVETVLNDYIPNGITGDKEQHKKSSFLLLLILKILHRLNKNQRKYVVILLERLEEMPINGIFVRESIRQKINRTYPASFNDNYFNQIEHLIDYLIKSYNQYRHISLQHLNLKLFTNNDDEEKVICSPHYRTFKNNINFISNTAVISLIRQLNQYD